MKAACYYGKEDIRVERVPDPQILNPRDAIVKVTTTAICGSDLHIYDGYIPTMKPCQCSLVCSPANSTRPCAAESRRRSRGSKAGPNTA